MSSLCKRLIQKSLLSLNRLIRLKYNFKSFAIRKMIPKDIKSSAKLFTKKLNSKNLKCMKSVTPLKKNPQNRLGFNSRRRRR